MLAKPDSGPRRMASTAALHFPHLAAIHRLRSSLPGVRQIRDRVRRHAFDELGAHRAVAKNSRRSADDLVLDSGPVSRVALAFVPTANFKMPGLAEQQGQP